MGLSPFDKNSGMMTQIVLHWALQRYIGGRRDELPLSISPQSTQ
jgi:hypothetical protein